MLLSRFLRSSFSAVGNAIQIPPQPPTQRTRLVVLAGDVRFGCVKRLCSSNALTTTSSSFPTTYNNNNNNSQRRITSSSHSHRYYHTTPLRESSIRRRRRRGQASPSTNNRQSDDDDYDKGTARRPIRRVKAPVEFETRATALVDKIYAALVPLQAINDPFVLTRDRDPEIGHGEYILLDVGPLFGQYTLQVDPEQAVVHFQSPTSGLMQYYCSLEDGEWRSMEDGHILEGLLVRDLIRQIKGVPKL
mmetsp:Transcript_14006/g.26846  ORF Transcript_14006/g.26846 Transcript_14006/m.26846 type:complete len:247 (+) Transcript_14006:134-874(+)